MTIDAFDEIFDAPAASQQTTATRTYSVAPAGIAEVEIVAATIGDVPWKKSDANPTGTCLNLRLSAGREYSFIFADLPRDKKPLFRALAAALGVVPGPDGKASIGPAAGLIGRVVRVEIGHYQTKSGDTKAGVTKWLPPVAVEQVTQTSAPTSAPVAAKPEKRASTSTPQWSHDDDIPF